jgi:hypothetical protein
MSVGNLYEFDNATLAPIIPGGTFKSQIFLNPLIKNASMVGGICTSGTYSVYAVILPTPPNQNTNYLKLYLVTYDNFQSNATGTTSNYPLPQPFMSSQGGFCPNYYKFGGATIQINIPNGQYFNIAVSGAASPNHRHVFFLYGF